MFEGLIKKVQGKMLFVGIDVTGTNAPEKMARSPVPGGWVVCVYFKGSQSTFFYPDPTHTWDGNSTSLNK